MALKLGIVVKDNEHSHRVAVYELIVSLIIIKSCHFISFHFAQN